MHPDWAVPGSRVVLEGAGFPLPEDGPPEVRIGGREAHVVMASSRRLRIVVPQQADPGINRIQVEGHSDEPEGTVLVARVLAAGIHQVDSPAFDGLGRLYVTQSGGPGATTSVPLYRVSRDGTREAVPVEIANPTSLAHGPDGAMYVSSRFERVVYRLTTDDRVEVYASDLGVPTGLAFARDGSLFVGDRSGSVLRIGPTRQVDTFATLPSSVAAFHLAFGPDDCLYVAAPTLASRDVVYRLTPDAQVQVACSGFGRPQGLAFDRTGALYVVDAVAGASGLYRVNVQTPRPEPALVLSAPGLVGVAFDPEGGVALASNDTLWRLDADVRPYFPPG
ncbi:MAG: gluconolaconase [Acidobacteria bacterium]|nr:gluconolaconase [Acidobacteriota bacterium]